MSTIICTSVALARPINIESVTILLLRLHDFFWEFHTFSIRFGQIQYLFKVLKNISQFNTFSMPCGNPENYQSLIKYYENACQKIKFGKLIYFSILAEKFFFQTLRLEND